MIVGNTTQYVLYTVLYSRGVTAFFFFKWQVNYQIIFVTRGLFSVCRYRLFLLTQYCEFNFWRMLVWTGCHVAVKGGGQVLLHWRRLGVLRTTCRLCGLSIGGRANSWESLS